MREGEVGGERRERLTGTGADVRTPFMKTEKGRNSASEKTEFSHRGHI